MPGLGLSCKTKNNLPSDQSQSYQLTAISDDTLTLVLKPDVLQDKRYFFAVCKKQEEYVIEDSCINAFRSSDGSEVSFDFIDINLLSTANTPITNQLGLSNSINFGKSSSLGVNSGASVTHSKMISQSMLNQRTNSTDTQQAPISPVQREMTMLENAVGTGVSIGTISLIIYNQLRNKGKTPSSLAVQQQVVDLTTNLEMNKVVKELDSALVSVTKSTPEGVTKRLFSTSNAYIDKITQLQREYIVDIARASAENGLVSVDISMIDTDPQKELLRKQVQETLRKKYLPRFNSIISEFYRELNKNLQFVNAKTNNFVPPSVQDEIYTNFIGKVMNSKQNFMNTFLENPKAADQVESLASHLQQIGTEKQNLLAKRAQAVDGSKFRKALAKINQILVYFNQARNYLKNNPAFRKFGGTLVKSSSQLALIKTPNPNMMRNIIMSSNGKLAKAIVRPAVMILSTLSAGGLILTGVSHNQESTTNADAESQLADVNEEIAKQAEIIFEDDGRSSAATSALPDTASSQVFIENLDAILSVDSQQNKSVNSVRETLQNLGLYLRANLMITEYGSLALAKYCYPNDQIISCANL